MVKIFGQIDSGEVAARQEALSTWDRRGALVWCDDFEAPTFCKWDTNIDAPGTCALSTVEAWRGSQSVKTVTAPTTGLDVTLEKRFNLPIDRQVGAEFMFHIESGKPLVRLYIAGYNGTNYFGSEVRYNHNTGLLYYWNSAGAFIELPRYEWISEDIGSWIYMKLVIDTETKKYIRFIFGSTEYDLSALNLRSNADPSERMLVVFIYNMAATNEAATVYFDNFILTQNEP